jgi:hypothetical protein
VVVVQTSGAAMKPFQSAALLGVPHIYRASIVDQAKMIWIGNMPGVRGGKLACRLPTQTDWSFMYHTLDQVNVVLGDYWRAKGETVLR